MEPDTTSKILMVSSKIVSVRINWSKGSLWWANEGSAKFFSKGPDSKYLGCVDTMICHSYSYSAQWLSSKSSLQPWEANEWGYVLIKFYLSNQVRSDLGLQVYFVTSGMLLSRFSRVRLCDPIDGSLQAPLSLGFFRQEHWSGLPFNLWNRWT